MKRAVRERYSAAATRLSGGAGCCTDSGTSCCGTGDATSLSLSTGYREHDLIQIGMTRSISLGCGNPTALAELKAGELVLDLGSGGGMDVLLSARRVGPEGHAYGVDMTEEMLNLAEANKARSGIANATFLKGTIEAVPLPAEAVDVVISNCVINLAEDKGAVIGEAYRVLKPGGRLAVADMVELEALAPEIKSAADAWAGCIAGTIPVADYRRLLVSAGFADPEIEIHQITEVPGGGRIGSACIRAAKPAAL
ncbi:MAG: arsenite methyltransferase [Candidatus Dormibacteraeota bacterium]|nr:arsenite methyltransferase [Candidatus Dormibacteraeota bacterium]